MFYVGLDLGQRRDYSAIAVVEKKEQRRAFQALPEFEGLHVRHVERVALGTPYPQVVARVGRMVEHDELRGRCTLAVDATGVGAPVVEMLRGAQLGCEIDAVTITGGEREQGYPAVGGGDWNVPKQDLIAGVQVLLEQNELRIARKMRDTGSLVRELMDMRVTQGRAGRLRLGADGCGEHDDLVIALALACWRARRKREWAGFGTRRLPGI